MLFSTTAALFREMTDSPVKPPVTKAIFFFIVEKFTLRNSLISDYTPRV
jgi:hypothetical protein